MYLSDEKIINQLIEYITDKRYKQAILIDGDWGSGKTFFIQEKLVNSLNEHIDSGTKYSRSVFYISLYGMESFSQIIDEIYTASLESYFDEKLGNGKGEKVGRGINFASKVITAGLKYFNIDTEDLPKISEIKQLKNAIVIFDDLERCTIDTNQLLGFINNLVEHNDIKVIIVANQAEIGKTKLHNDLPQKYSVVLNPQLKLLDDIEGVSKEQLIQYTEQIFAEDMLYEKVKEKLIGLTIHYQADFSSIYENLVDKYINEKAVKTELITYKDLVLGIFNQRQHCNIRTLIFAIMAYEKISSVISNIIFQPSQYINRQKEQILKYTLELSIQLKLGKKIYSWSNNTAQSGMVHFDNSGIWGKSIFGYKFIDTYLMNRYLDSDEVSRIVFELMKEAKNIDEHRDVENSLSFNKIYFWWKLEDSEIMPLLDEVSKELSELKYHPRYFKDIITRLMQLEHFGFKNLNFDNYVPYMKQKLEEHDDAAFKIQNLQLLSDDKGLVQQYNQIVQSLFTVLEAKERTEKEKINESLNLDESWGETFCSGCSDYRQNYMSDKKFFFYIDPIKIISKLQSSSVKDIYLFLDGIKQVYNFSNLNDIFKEDAEHLQVVLDKFKLEDISEGKITKRIALEELKTKLAESLVQILK